MPGDLKNKEYQNTKLRHLYRHTISPGKFPKPAKHKTPDQSVKATNICRKENIGQAGSNFSNYI